MAKTDHPHARCGGGFREREGPTEPRAGLGLGEGAGGQVPRRDAQRPEHHGGRAFGVHAIDRALPGSVGRDGDGAAVVERNREEHRGAGRVDRGASSACGDVARSDRERGARGEKRGVDLRVRRRGPALGGKDALGPDEQFGRVVRGEPRPGPNGLGAGRDGELPCQRDGFGGRVLRGGSRLAGCLGPDPGGLGGRGLGCPCGRDPDGAAGFGCERKGRKQRDDEGSKHALRLPAGGSEGHGSGWGARGKRNLREIGRLCAGWSLRLDPGLAR
jgi:hypothetical protein